MRRTGSSGIRFINGQEYMLSGRFETRERALVDAEELRKEWTLVKVLKVRHIFGCYSCWVHGAK